MKATVILLLVGLLPSVIVSFVAGPVCRCRRDGYRRASSVTAAANNEKDDLWSEILQRFQGDFDNYRQVVDDRQQGLEPKAGGGHENIHCTLVPVSESARLAAFYFDGTPHAIFRFRFYQLQKVENETAVDTVLYTLHPDLERQLRQNAGSPMEWKTIFDDFQDDKKTYLLPKCDVRWSWRRDPELHAYAQEENGIHAVMVHGQAIVESQMLPGKSILIKDQLSLWPDALWIHDRGFDVDTGDFIYGNQRNIPYQLDRVASIVNGKREVTDRELQWTLGPSFRTTDEYEKMIDGMGGPSIPKR